MSGGVPDEAQLRRIERGVEHRIGRRRRVAQRVGGTAGVLGALAVVVGGFALVLPRAASSPSALSGGGSAGESSGGSGSSALVKVECHGDRATLAADADPGRLPASALEACARALSSDAAPDSSPGSPVEGQSAGSASPSALPGALCRADDGVLHVYVDGTACSSVGMTRVR